MTKNNKMPTRDEMEVLAIKRMADDFNSILDLLKYLSDEELYEFIRGK